MYQNKKVVVALPAYNAVMTLSKTLNEIPKDIVDDVILVDDASTDNTYNLAINLGIKHVIKHEINKGNGANQKSCYKKALEINADIVIMDPDYQNTPLLIPSKVGLIGKDSNSVVLASRILGKGAIKGGVPLYKHFFNRILTLLQNIIINQKLSENVTGYSVFSANVLRSINLKANSDDFLLDNQMICQTFYEGFEIGEITSPTKYFADASSINFKGSFIYSLGCLYTS